MLVGRVSLQGSRRSIGATASQGRLGSCVAEVLGLATGRVRNLSTNFGQPREAWAGRARLSVRGRMRFDIRTSRVDGGRLFSDASRLASTSAEPSRSRRAASGSRRASSCVDKIGIDNVMWAIDYPYQPTAPAVAFLESARLSSADLERIAHSNAERIFGIQA